MGYPTKYARQYDFQSYQNANPNRPLPADKINADYNAAARSTSEIIDFLRTSIRADGVIMNGAVGYDQLSPALQSAGIAPADPWVGSHDYKVGNSVVTDGSLYRAIVSHTSTVFATDLAAGNWLFIANIATGPQGPAGTIAVHSVTTLPAGSSATVTNVGTAEEASLDFAIPQGLAGSITVNSTSTLPAGSPATVVNVGTTSAASFDFGIPKGDTGPAAWSVPTAWATATAYVAGPPASAVVQAGETYVCLVSHTSGVFATDVAAGKWIKVTQAVATGSIEAVIDGGGGVLTTGLKGYLVAPFACTITEALQLADRSGSIVVDIWKCTYAQFDAGATHPVAGDKITASAPPTISGDTKSKDATLTGWTKAISAGDILAFNINSVSTIQRVTLSLKFTK